MSLGVYDWLILAAVPIIAWWLGRQSRPPGTWRGYFLAQGTLGTTSVLSTYVGANLTFTTIFLILSEEGYRRGPWVFAIPALWVVGTIVFLLLYPRLRPFFERGATLHQALGEAFKSRTLQRWASVWTIVAFAGTVALEFYGGIRLLEWAHIPLLINVTIALVLVFLVASFTVTGGFRGVARADIWLDSILLLGVGVLGYYVWKHSYSLQSLSPPKELLGTPPAIPPTVDNILFVIAAAIIFLPFLFCTLDTWQRMAAWQKRGSAPTVWLPFGAALVAVAFCVPIAVGMILRRGHLTNPLMV